VGLLTGPAGPCVPDEDCVPQALLLARMAARGIRFPWANLALLFFLALQLVTGIVGLLGTGDPFRIVFWLHAIGAYAIVVLLFAKAMLVVNALRRRPGLTEERVTLAVLGLMLVIVLVSGLVWISAGSAVYVAGVSLINFHSTLATLLVVLLAGHVLDRRWVARVPAARDRAAFLKLAGVTFAGVALWQVERTLQRWFDWPGSRRRFTGSYETGSFTGDFPAVSWFNDDPDTVDRGAWRLVVDGAVERPLALDYDGVLARGDATLTAIVDCTGGWYSEQRWQGVRVARLLEEAGLADRARSVAIESVTGYGRRFSLDDARRLTLATHVAGRPLTHEHGFPARLVVLDQRGFEWVKWVTRVRVLESSHLLQSPLPLS
jgi:DMSO/TMAO reductase YedYZ molybdopterin-dependent catalytic subunit